MFLKTTNIKLVTFLISCFSLPALGDCVRSCEANLFVKLSYQPVGDTTTVKKTHALKTLAHESRDGRSGRTCVPHNIIKAKERACSDAARDLGRRFSSRQQQMAAVCGAVQHDQDSFERARLGFPAADWYSIDTIWAFGKRDIVKRRANIQPQRVRFSCNNGVAAIYNPSHTQPTPPTANSESAAPPPPPTASSEGAAPPPPPTASSGDAAPPPPPTLHTGDSSGRKPDLYISEFKMTPETPVKGQPVNIRIGVYNKGTAQSGPFTVKWWPGENYNTAGCSWNINKMNARGGRILKCTYGGYPSWYGRINTKVVADTSNRVMESNEGNNVLKKRISVSR